MPGQRPFLRALARGSRRGRRIGNLIDIDGNRFLHLLHREFESFSGITATARGRPRTSGYIGTVQALVAGQGHLHAPLALAAKGSLEFGQLLFECFLPFGAIFQPNSFERLPRR